MDETKSSRVPSEESPSTMVPESEKTAINIPEKVETSESVDDVKYGDADDGKTKKDGKDEKEKAGSLKDYFRIYTFADRLDILLYAIAYTGALATGAALPLMTLVFGQSTGNFATFAGRQATVAEKAAFKSNVNHLVLYFVYLFIARFVIGYISTLCACVAATRVTRKVRAKFLESLLRQEVWYFDKAGGGSPATQVTTNGDRVTVGISEKTVTLVNGIALFFSAYIVALSVQWKLALITMSIVPLIIGTIGGCLAFDAPVESRITRTYSRAAVLAQDALSSIRTIHAFGAQDKIVKTYDEYLLAAYKDGKKKSLIFGILFSTQTFFVMSATAFAFWYGQRMLARGEISNVGTVFTVVLSVALGATSTLLVFPSMQAITNASSAAAELFSVIDKESLLDPLSPEGAQPSTCAGDIQIRDLRFAYPTRPTAQVLHGLNLSLPAGKTIALVGPSGCGKSTLVGLLERWYMPASGEIILDGQPLESYNTKWLRSNFRLVQQEPILFQGTIYENVAKGLVGEQRDLPEEKHRDLIEEACKSSNAHDFVSALPEGYNTQVGERASMLSGGQRQRIAIARSIVSDPKVLLLDEATSALDPRAERVVQDALNRVSANKTTLIIAHKLATVMAADSIAVMKAGQVVEQGTHRELLARDGLYAAMVRAQDLGAKAEEAAEGTEEKAEAQAEVEAEAEATMGRPLTLQRTVTKAAQTDLERQAVAHLAAETLNYTLIRCIWILLKEHPDLYVWYAVTAVGGIIGGGTYPAQAIVFSRLVGVFSLKGQAATDQAAFWALMFFVLALANLFGYFGIGWACNSIGQVITRRIRREMIERMVYNDQEFFDLPANSSGSLTSKLSSVPTSLQELMSGNLGLILNVLINIIGSSILGIVFSWRLGLTLVFGGLTPLVVAGYIRIRLDQKLENSTGAGFSGSAGLATEAVTSIKTVSFLALESSVLEEYNGALDGIIKKVLPGLAIMLFPYALSQSIEFLVMGLGFWYGSQLIVGGQLTIQSFFVCFIAIIFSGQGAGQFFAYTTSITKGKIAANYVLWLRTIKATIRETDENRSHKPSGDGAIGIENVEFRYKQRDTARVLRGVTMNIEPGTYAAIVGPSGCGKSTIIALAERFYDPTSGRITLKGEDIAAMSPFAYRRYMSLVQQEPPLYLGSVRDNIAIGLEHEPTEEEVSEACRQANALEFISSLPEGLNTPCGAKGLQFSGGQRQRIAVARALIRQPRLLLLDEATSALDTQSERIVQQALDEAALGRTTIAVAHRLSTIKNADVIFVVEDGRIVEQGKHDELQRLKGRYYAMCLAQSLDQGDMGASA
nr:hypothetical protein B0A51_05270 [Rachicladosporium sp. CCFEE 5018]